MFDKFFEKYSDYQIVEKPTSEQIAAYRNQLPDPILSLWTSHGWGMFMDGYLRLIDPALFQSFVDEYVERTNSHHTPWAVTVFGDLFTYKSNGYIDFYDYRHAASAVMGNQKNIDILFDHKFTDESYIWSKLNCANFNKVKAKIGLPAYNQCYGYFPLLALGGSETADHVQIVDLNVHMNLMAQVSGPL